jgi:hypothetical protein
MRKKFKLVLKVNGLDQQRIKPHCPEENGVIELSNPTTRETGRMTAEAHLLGRCGWPMFACPIV